MGPQGQQQLPLRLLHQQQALPQDHLESLQDERLDQQLLLLGQFLEPECQSRCCQRHCHCQCQTAGPGSGGFKSKENNYSHSLIKPTHTCQTAVTIIYI